MPRILILVTSDPRTSARPAEAIRIAAGIAAWKKVDVQVYLHGPAALALSEFPDDLVDEDNFVRYLPVLIGSGHPVFVEKGISFLKELGDSRVPHQESDLIALTTLASQATAVLRF